MTLTRIGQLRIIQVCGGQRIEVADMTDSERIVQLETRLALLEAEREHLATKGDLHQRR